MRQKLLLLLLLLASWGARAQTLLQQQSFEGTGTDALAANSYTATAITTNGNIYFYNATLPVPGFNTGSGQVSTVTNINGIAANSTGTHFWASENVRRDANGVVRGNPAANVTLASLNVAGKNSLSVTVALANAAGLPNNTVLRWETDDYVRIQYRFDGTGAWNTIGQFVGDDPGTGGSSGNLRQDKSPLDGISNVNLEPNSPVLNQTLTDYSFAIPGSGNTLEVRVEIDQDGASEEFGFDNIRVYGTGAVGSPPVLGSIEPAALAYAEGQAATQITNTLTVSDQDNATLTSATIRVSTNYMASEDRLSFTGDATTGNIAANAFDAVNGVLTLTSASSTATLAQWQSALRKVLYQNIDPIDASAATRTVTFLVTDPNNNTSGAALRNITVSTALDAASGLPYSDSFETDGEGARYASNHFYTQDASQFQRTTSNPITGGTTFSNIAGSAYWVGVNTAGGIALNPTGLNKGILTTKQVNATGYTNLHFQIRLGASTSVANGNLANWKTTDYFQLLYRPSGSPTWTAFGLFRGTSTTTSGGIIRQDSNPNGTGAPTGTQLTSALQNFDFTLPTALNGQTVDFQLVLANQDGVNFFAFDLIQVTGTQVVAPTVTTTSPATSLTTTTATVSGTLTSDGGGNITSYGVVYLAGTGTPTLTNQTGQVVAGTSSPGTFPSNFSANLTGLMPGTTYTAAAYATNSAGTNYGANVTFTTIVNPPVVTGNPLNRTICAGSNTTFSATFTGATSFQWQLNSGSGFANLSNGGVYSGATTTTLTITGATASLNGYQYRLVATNSGGSTNSSAGTLTVSSISLTSGSQTNVSCFGGTNGTATVVPTGGIGSYTYSWSPNVSASATATGLAAGSYTVTVTDAIGCTAQRTFTITQPAAPVSGTTVVTNVACNGGTNGAINLTPTGGTGAGSYTFLWSPGGQTTEDRTNLTAGTYTVTITDANGCTGTVSATVTQPTAISLASGSSTNVSCFGGSNGSATVSPSGGAGGYSYAYSPSGGTGPTATGLAAGTYVVTVTDANGCTAQRTFTIIQPPALATTGSQTNVSCNGGSNGSATVTVSGGTSGYTYSWSPSVSASATATGLAAGTYVVTVTDANGCIIQRTFTIAQPAALTATTSQTNVTTFGGTNGSATIAVSGGTGTYTYSWSPNVSTTATASNLSAGTYVVTVTDANGCIIQRTFTITQPAAPTITISPASLPPAMVGITYSQALTATGGTAPYTYAVTGGALPAGLTLSNGTIAGTPTAGGSFSFTVTATGTGGFTGSQTYSAFSVAAATIVLNPTSLPGGAVATPYNQTITASGGTPSYTFSFTGTLPTGLTLSSTGVLSGTPLAAGTFNFTVTATDASTGTGAPYSGSQAYTVIIASPLNTIWTGAISPDWFTAGNWTAGLPTTTISATIPASTIFQPSIGSGTASALNLTLNSGATLSQSGGTLDVRGNLISNGSFQPTGGTVVLGTAFQSNGPNILGSSRVRFWNLTVNSNGVLLSTSAGASVRRLLSLSGAFVTQGNAFVLESDASGTALVVNVNSGGFVFGSATVQRYLDASGNTGTSGYRHYSAPVGFATVSSLSTSAYGGGFTAQVNTAYNTANPNLLTLATYPNVFSYDESKIAGSPAAQFSDFDKGYQSPQSTSDALTVGRGYAVQIGNSEKVQFTGPLNNATQTITGLTYAAANTAGAGSAGWALVGNPYPAPLDWGTVGAANTGGSGLSGVDAAAYVFQSTSAYAGRYTSFTNGVGAGTGLIATGQAFFVHTTTPGTTGSITLNNTNRVTTYASPNFQRQGETRPLVRLSVGLGSQPATVATAQDETFVYFETGATDSFDGKYDAYKLANPSGYYLGSVTPGSSPLGLSIDARSPLAVASTTEIPLWVSLPAGAYTLTATELLNFAGLAGGTQVQLRDALLGTLTDLSTTPSHSFSVAANAPYTGRFSLVFRTSQVLAALPGAELTQAQASLYPNPATSATALSVTGLPAAVAAVQVEVLDVLGRAVAHYELPARAGSVRQSVATSQLAGSLYLLRLTALDAQGQVLGNLPTQRLTLTH